MCPADPRLREGEEEEEAEAPATVEDLLALAKAYRAGTAPGGRDMKKCYETYLLAAEHGSAEAEYAAALFVLAGGVVPQDLKEGATRLRSAADKGNVPARVYLGNLYELGIHYKADPEKADVWYRSAARAARVDAEPGTAAYSQALAELGCARYAVALSASPDVDEPTKALVIQRAKAHGYGLRVREEASSPRQEEERATLTDALATAEARPVAAGPLAGPLPAAAAPAEAKTETKTKAKTKTARDKRAKGPAEGKAGALAAFGYAVLFVVAGLGAAYAASLGARELLAHGHPLPGLGPRVHLVFPIVLALVGVLPSALVYRLGAVVKAVAAGAALGGVGWVAWGTGQGAVHAARVVQAMAFGLGGFLAALLVLGLLGGTKRRAQP